MDDEEQAMSAIHAEHSGAVRAFVSRYVDDHQLAQDVVQETMLRAWRTLDRIDPGRDSTRSYLLTIARNVLTDGWRAAQRRPQLVGDDAALAAAAQTPTAAEGDVALEGWLIAEALGQLSSEHRVVVQSVYFEGRTVAETAERLGVPLGTVKSRAFYAVRALRATFEEMGVLR